MEYFLQLEQPEWKLRSLYILTLHGFTCDRCRKKDVTLNAHHKYYDLTKMAWDYPDSDFECLCEHCHTLEHEKDCCKSILFHARYDADMRQRILVPLKPSFCPFCGSTLSPRL